MRRHYCDGAAGNQSLFLVIICSLFYAATFFSRFDRIAVPFSLSNKAVNSLDFISEVGHSFTVYLRAISEALNMMLRFAVHVSRE
jgi:hypothetical protein